MIFQTFDDKEDCILIYQNKQFHDTFSDLQLTSTWSYANYLKDKDIEYARLWVQGLSLVDVCPPHKQDDRKCVEKQLKAFIRSCSEAKIDLDDICFYELAPKGYLRDYADVKNEICAHVFKSKEKPANYDHILNLVKVISDIRYRPLNLDLSKMNNAAIRDKNTFHTVSSCQKYVSYDPFKTVTGRLSTNRGFFPALTLGKEYRNILTPDNDWLFELDFNAAELRTVLALLGQEQPEEDLHDWNIENVFKGQVTREEAKKRVFAWLYNPSSSDYMLNRTYDRDKIKETYFRNNKVYTDYNREIQCDDFHATNYIIQSTSADVLFEQMYKVWRMLEGKRSCIKFCNHDSIMIDFSEEDQDIINDIKELFSDTRYGKFKINCFAGKRWGSLKKLRIY